MLAVKGLNKNNLSSRNLMSGERASGTSFTIVKPNRNRSTQLTKQGKVAVRQVNLSTSKKQNEVFQEKVKLAR